MQSKSLLIAIAAFAVTASGVHAYGGSKTLYRAGLNKDQVQAVQEATNLRAEGDLQSARDRLVEAGIDDQVLRSIHREVNHERKRLLHSDIYQSYRDFKAATKNSPIGDLVTSEADFKLFMEAHDLRKSGEWEAANLILTDLGINIEKGKRAGLNQDQWSGYLAARRANQKEIMTAILDEAGD